MSINNTVTTALTNNGLGQYDRHAAPVVTALIEREQGIYNSLMEAAVAKGLPRNEAVRLFEGVGLHAPTQDAAAEVGDLAALSQQVNSLVTFARANGFRG